MGVSVIKITDYGNATQDQLLKLNTALGMVNITVLPSNIFKQKVLSATFTETTDTNQQVYDKITGQDIEISVSFYLPSWWQRMKQRFSGLAVVAAECGGGEVTFNATVFENNSIYDLAGTLLHEASHAIGYTHDFNPTPDRPKSVPYQLGDIVTLIVQPQQN